MTAGAHSSRPRRHRRPRRPRRHRSPARGLAGIAAVLVVFVAGTGAFQMERPYPPPRIRRMEPASLVVPGADPPLPWPATGEAAISVEGIGTLGSLRAADEVPIASLTKIMTALVVLGDHPLAPDGAGSAGPSIAVTISDVDQAFFEALGGQSVVRVAAGEILTERQALEAMLLPSANNVADLLAAWDAGSKAAFVAKMNARAAMLGMDHTRYADASGIDPASTSTASDQLLLTEVAMGNPTFASIVAEPHAVLPVAGLVENFNALVGSDGFIGVKTGSTSEAGGCLAFVTVRTLDGRRFSVAGVVLGQSGGGLVAAALRAGKALADAAARRVLLVRAVPEGQAVAQVVLASGARVPVAARATAALLGWQGLRLRVRLSLDPLPPPGAVPAKRDVSGSVTVAAGFERASAPVATARPVGSPSVLWRLTRS